MNNICKVILKNKYNNKADTFTQKTNIKRLKDTFI